MPRTSPDLRSFFLGRLSGETEVLGLTGRRRRTFQLEFRGEWSIGEDALHLDQRVEHPDGRVATRYWAIQFDEQGDLLGYDSKRDGRIRGRVVGDKVRVIFDRPLSTATEFASNRLIMLYTQEHGGALMMDGRAMFFGLVVGRTRALLQRD